MPILRGDAEVSSSLRVTVVITHNEEEISTSPRNIDIYIYIYIYIYMILFEQNCNNLKMAAIGRNM